MSEKAVIKRHPAPHVSFKSGKHRCKSVNTITKAKVHGVIGSAIHALTEAVKNTASLQRGNGIPMYISKKRQFKKNTMAKLNFKSGKAFKRWEKRIKIPNLIWMSMERQKLTVV
jgi:hypothetical protein